MLSTKTYKLEVYLVILLVAYLVLVNSVLSSSPLYYMSIFIVPQGILQNFDRFYCQFLWEGLDSQHKMSRVWWDIVCRPKQVRGLDVVDLRIRNFSLLAKWSLSFTMEPNSLWCKLISAKYGQHKVRWYLNSARHSRMSTIWHNIVAAQEGEELKQFMSDCR
ncbi:hypothetical protein V6N11_030648 [Hibiscus sabdariffa]|uniref:Uncharacterized protein n=2 Tax=Hibiscus sabdariffa TaxID=183260 RepID=A0ABR2A1Q2_9ROSI